MQCSKQKVDYKSECLFKYLKIDEEIGKRIRSNNINKCARYFNSSQTKRHIANLLAQSSITEKPCTCASLSKKTGYSKTAVLKIINESVEAGYVDETYFKTQRFVKAGKEMLDAYFEYVSFRETLWKKYYPFEVKEGSHSKLSLLSKVS